MIAKKQAKAKQGRQASAPTAYPLHPVTREYDDFTVTEANVVRESLRALGLRNPIVLWKGQIVDGRHRDMFCRELGIKARYDDLTNRCKTEEDMRAYVAALNEHRRSRTKPLTIEEKREKVDAALKADPERSDQAIAEECGVSVPFVGKRRKKGVNVNTDPAKRRSRTGKRGEGQRKKQPHRSPKPKPKPEPDAEPEPEPDRDDNAQDDGNGKARSPDIRRLGAFWDTATEQDRARFAQSHRTVLLKALGMPLEAAEPSQPGTADSTPPPISMFPIAAALEIISMLGNRPKKWKVDVARQMLLLLEREPAPTEEPAPTQPAEEPAAV